MNQETRKPENPTKKELKIMVNMEELDNKIRNMEYELYENIDNDEEYTKIEKKLCRLRKLKEQMEKRRQKEEKRRKKNNNDNDNEPPENGIHETYKNIIYTKENTQEAINTKEEAEILKGLIGGNTNFEDWHIFRLGVKTKLINKLFE